MRVNVCVIEMGKFFGFVPANVCMNPPFASLNALLLFVRICVCQ